MASQQRAADFPGYQLAAPRRCRESGHRNPRHPHSSRHAKYGDSAGNGGASRDPARHNIHRASNVNASARVGKVPKSSTDRNTGCSKRGAMAARGGVPGRNNPWTTRDRPLRRQNWRTMLRNTLLLDLRNKHPGHRHTLAGYSSRTRKAGLI